MSLGFALNHYERGFALVPVRPRSKQPDTRVLREVHGTDTWGPLALRRASRAEITAWHQIDPEINVGAILGQPSGGVVVADFDRKPHGVRHPPTPIVATARGFHAYFRSSGPVATREHDWGELRGDGSYVVLPDSIHPSGDRYEYALTLDDVQMAMLADLQIGARVVAQDESSEADPRYGGSEYRLPVYPDAEVIADLSDVATLACQEDAVVEMLRSLRIDAPIGRAFRCILPGHGERRPSASIYRDPSDHVFKYHDWHRRDGLEWLSLAWVRAALGYRKVKPLAAPETARWYLRLFYEAGLLSPVEVGLPCLTGASGSLQTVAEGFRLLVGLRRRVGDGDPVAFTRSFAGAWCGVGERQAGQAICELRNRGVIVKAREHVHGAKRTNLFLPG